MSLIAGFKTDPGLNNAINEDSFYINLQIGLVIIADGIGGNESGEIASRMAVETIKKIIEKHPISDSIVEILEQSVIKANEEIYKFGIKNNRNPGTTILLGLIKENKLFIAHVGDSRAYIFRSNKLRRITDDHTLASKMIQSGQLTFEQARLYPKYKTLFRALGMETTVEVDKKKLDYHGEPLLFCSDGLSDMLTDQEIEKIIKEYPNPQKACDVLIKTANLKGGWDNITAILIKRE